MARSDKDMWAAEYVLGTLRGAERSEFERALAMDAELAQKVHEWNARLADIDLAAADEFDDLADHQVQGQLDRVFENLATEVNSYQNPLMTLTPDQREKIRPAIVRLLASYMVLLERLKEQQRQQSRPVAASGT